MCSIFPNWSWLLGGRWTAGKDLPAVRMTFLPIPLRRKFFTWLLHVQYLSSKKMIKVSLKTVSCVAFWRQSLTLGGRTQGPRWLTQGGGVPWLRGRREQCFSGKRPENVQPGLPTPASELCCCSDVLGPWNLTGVSSSQALPPRVPVYRPSKPSRPTVGTRDAQSQIEVKVRWS